MNAIGYMRVSTDKQADAGVSLEMQRERIQAWCDERKIAVVGWYEDAGVSGRDVESRPGVKAALDAVCAEGGVLVVYDLTRLSRSTYQMLGIGERLQASGAHLASVTQDFVNTTTPVGCFLFSMMAALAQLERGQASERTKAALRHLKESGERWTRHAPMGYKWVDGRLERDDEVMAEASRIQEALKVKSLRAVAAEYGLSVGRVRRLRRVA